MNIECSFLGVLVRDAEQRTSKSGRPYLLLNVRVDEGHAVQWVNVRCFDKDAVEIADEFVKNERFMLRESLSERRWRGEIQSIGHVLPHAPRANRPPKGEDGIRP